MILLLPNTAFAFSSILFTTTANFDVGVKAPTTDGNIGIETNTDNLNISANSIELGSAKGDSFTTTDNNANTAKWTPCTIGSPTQSAQSISGGVENQDVRGPAGNNRAGIRSDSTYQGDLDFSIKLDRFQNQDGADRWLLVINLNICDFTGATGVLYQVLEQTPTTSTFSLTAFILTAGTATVCGSATNVNSNPVWLRISRVTNTWTFKYSTDGTTYITDETGCVQIAAGPLRIVPTTGDNIPGGASSLVRSRWDDFFFRSGIIDSGAFRTTGEWTSAIQEHSAEVFQSITIEYSGASVSNFITSIALLNSVGVSVFSDNTDITSDITKTYTIPDLFIPNTWRIRIGLSGNGTATVNVQTITVHTELKTDIFDSEWLKVSIYLFAFIFSFVLGYEKHPSFYILCGIVGIAFAVELFFLIESAILTAVISGLSLLIIVHGIITKIPE